MRYCVLCDDGSWRDLFQDQQVHLLDPDAPHDVQDDDILFDLRDEAWDLPRYQRYKTPVFIAAVIGTLKARQAPPHIIRINAWPGMLSRPAIEAAADPQVRSAAEGILAGLNKKLAWVEDITGMVSPRVITMIINEACFAWEDGVSNRESIDEAMKLGTNYPKGPFEWAETLGWQRVRQLQQALAAGGAAYSSSKTLSGHG